MIESENLRTASLYINNQLLSRGLLRDGNGIDFAHPGDTDAEVAETMSRVMAVINDLILRRDRDAEHRESLSTTLRTLRAESLRQANDIQRLQEKYAEAQRKVGLSEAAEAALRTNLKASEATVHRLKEEAARTKSLVAQTRASCANEVRKRDRQIESLKKAVTEAARARGAGKGTGVTSITVVGDTGSEAEHGSRSCGAAGQNCDLRTETNAFLSELARSLSEENEGLLQLIRRTTEQLKEMSGWDVVNGNPPENGDGHALALASNPADLSIEVDAVLEHLRTILTNPSFVPIEEVVVREDEIHRLRDGWEKMETRWKEAVHLMDGWRKRMQASGRPVNVEELKMGLRLSPVKVKNVEETSHGYALRLGDGSENEEEDDPQPHCDEGPLDLVPHREADDDGSDASSMFDHDVDVDDLDVEEPNVEILQQSIMLPSAPIPSQPELSPLRDSFTAANRGERPHNRKPPKGFPTIAEENARNIDAEEPPLPPPHLERLQQSPHRKPILSLRTVPPEEAAKVELPPSAAVSTPDTSVESMPLNKAADEHTSKTSAAAAPAAKAQKRVPPTTRNREPSKKVDPVKGAEVAKKVEPFKRETTRREVVRKEEGEKTKNTSKPPAKPRPSRPPITRGRSETRPDEHSSHSARPPRAASATSAASVRSTGTNRSTANRSANKSPNKSANAEPAKRPPSPSAPAAGPSPAPSPSRSPKRVNSRLPLPRPGCNNALPAPQQSPLNMEAITAKLAASEREADAARVRAKLKAARLGKGVNLPPSGATRAAGSTEFADTDFNPADAATAAISTRSESDSATTRTASTSASTSDGAPPSCISTATTATAAGDEDADELGFSPPVKAPQPGRSQAQKQHERRRQPQPHQQQQQQQQQEQRQEREREQQQRQHQQQNQVVDTDPKKSPVRKRERRTSRVTSRRRSTLNPWELDALIQGGNVTVGR
ncbi:Afadin and alpha-actinin-binding-domain-containing protein [Thermothelomyces heterothallicus CBS 202.75]|uniref:Afadin and alpha-actinin-binding-domain-containing protein n=1 Tax=Thermothelomyces heterothallicus CBS 202.75 TaxID=1149848 RepID=UPI0037435E68